MNLSHYLWKKVNIRCKDGRFFSEHYVVAYDDRYDNVEPDEDGIGIVKNKDDNYGVEIYESEIESIEIVDWWGDTLELGELCKKTLDIFECDNISDLDRNNVKLNFSGFPTALTEKT